MIKVIRLTILLLLCGSGIGAMAPVVGLDSSYTALDRIKQQLASMKVSHISFTSQESKDSHTTIARPGILMKRKNAKGTVLICHGFLSNKHDGMFFRHLFPEFNVMSFDFRGHGDQSKGQVSTLGRDEKFDVLGAVKFLRQDPDIKDKPLFVYAMSMGAVAAIEAAAMYAKAGKGKLFDAMILDCPYDSTDEGMRRGLQKKLKFSLFGKEFNIPGTDFILKHMYDKKMRPLMKIIFKMVTHLDANKVPTKFVRVRPIESIKSVTIPCLFIHCENDKKVPVKAVQRLYMNAPGFKRLWITRGRKHFGSYLEEPEMYFYRINKFIKAVTRGHDSHPRRSKIYDDRAVITSAPVMKN